VRYIDWWLLCSVIILDILSVPLIDSATLGSFDQKQIVLILASIVVMIIATFIDYRDLVRLAPWIYAVTIGLLIAVLFMGSNVGGSTRWIPLPFFNLQPSEFAKLAMILLGSYMLSRMDRPPEGLWEFIMYFVWSLPLLVLILLQPDLGTTLVILAVAAGVLYSGGGSGKLLLQILLVVLLIFAIMLVLHFYAGLPLPIEDYQMKRLISLFNAQEDPLGTGYQVLQSKIAIGSGGLWGKGIGKGTQNQLDFIPHQETDFIFSVVGEELGFIRSVLVLGVYAILCVRILLIAISAADRMGTMVAGGVLSMLLFHILINVGMTMGIMPVTGVPLPFLSHGGSALMVNSFAVGMVLNVGWSRHKILF
jgi:rod shape determining protein RodA